MAVERRRGCGYRKAGGLYLIGTGIGVACGRLPHNLHICPVCGEGVRIGRNYRWIDGTRFFGNNCEKNCSCHNAGCVICESDNLGKCLVMSVGEKFYTPEQFILEAKEMGVSKRIPHVPQGLELGKTWVLLTHPKAGRDKVLNESGQEVEEDVPAIFYAFKAKRIEKVLRKRDVTPDVVQEFAKKGIDVVVVPDSDEDHQGTVYDDFNRNQNIL